LLDKVEADIDTNIIQDVSVPKKIDAPAPKKKIDLF